MLNQCLNLFLNICQRFHRFRFVLADAQHECAVAVYGDDVRVDARRAVFTYQTAVEDSVGNWLEVQLFRQVIFAEPTRLSGFNAGSLLCTGQRLGVVACRIAHFLLQRVVRIEGFFVFHFRRNVVTYFV